jgi:hypothetical protein
VFNVFGGLEFNGHDGAFDARHAGLRGVAVKRQVTILTVCNHSKNSPWSLGIAGRAGGYRC